ncbi:MAG: hypothetical protein IKW30_02725 [Lachnospiraceae bacterium]|nr:hypothetical protein [Lachnospiraceae bacterium]
MKNKKQIIGLNLFIIVIAAVYAVLMIMGNVKVVKSSVATVGGSYGEEYAIENKLNQVVLSDSQLPYFDQRYELFDYNVENGEVVLEGYEGKSSDLVIPAVLEGKPVVGMSDDFIASMKTVKNIYLPNSVKTIPEEAEKSLTLWVSEDSDLNDLPEESEWKIEHYYDSDFINFYLSELLFNYNVNGETIEITKYTGNDSLVVIPAYINGYPVTDVSMDFLGTAEIIVIPETVNNITGTSSKALYSEVFLVELIFTVMAFLIALITIDVLLPRYAKNLEEHFLTGSQMISVVVYVLAQTGFGIATTYFIILPVFLALIISVVILVVFIASMMLAGTGRKQAIEVEKRVAEKTSKMKAIKDSCKNLAGDVRDAQLRKEVQRLVDEIRFSDAVSRDDLEEMENEIEKAIAELKNSIASENTEEIKKQIELTMKMVKERNLKCKSGK